MSHEPKTVRLLPSDLRTRVAGSLMGGVFFASVVVATVFYIQFAAPHADGISSPLRTSHELNDVVARAIFSTQHLSVNKPAPGPGQLPRVNGDIGLGGDFDPTNYRIKVQAGDRELALSIAELHQMPRSQAATDFKCVEGWSQVIQYAGVKFSDFMDALKIGRKADGSLYRYVGFETPDADYYVSIDIESMLSPQTMLAYEMNQAELGVQNGAPLRLVIPSKYGIKNIKKIGRIFFSDIRPPDYWAEEGYDWFAGL